MFEHANHLKKRGHDVSIVYPFVPLRISNALNVLALMHQISRFLVSLKKKHTEKWFDLKARLVRITTLSPRFIRLFEKKIPDADAVVATSWETAYPVRMLKENKGRKFYFIQHYEIWDIWNDCECWREAAKIERESTKQSLAMAEIIPKSNALKSAKKSVDQTYRFPWKEL